MALVAVLAVTVPPLVAASDGGRLTGIVRDFESGTPIPGVQITVRSPSLTTPRLTTTDSAGRYDVGALPVGAFTVNASRETYVPSGFAYRRLLGTQGSVPLAAQEHRDRIDIRLTKEASISGRILEDDGRPVANAIVTVLRPHLDEGQHLLATYGSTRTDALGVFRVAGLLQGDYYVTAFEPDPTVSATVVARHSPTYYPGSPDAAGAKRIRVARAAAVSGIEFVVRRVPWSRVRGVALGPDGASLRSAAIILQPNDKEHLSPGPSLGATWLPDGGFTFDRVPPGEYIIRALGEIDEDSPTLFGELAVIVEGRDLTGLSMTLTRGAKLSGTIRFAGHGTKAPDVTPLRLSAPLVDGTRFGGEPRSRIDSGGRFTLVGVDAGLRLIRASQVPAPWSLERVLQGDVNITDTPIDIQPGKKLEDVELVFTDNAPSVNGTVRSISNLPIADGLVVAFPVDRSLWRPASRHIRSARTDWVGRFDLGPLPPGQYIIVSVQDFEEADIFERETLDQLARKATAISVTLVAGQVRVQDLRDDTPGGL
jgi:hypothetical protein